MRRWVEPVAIATTKLGVSLVVVWSGFQSVSDDDFARVTIAQAFARHPSLDPSGTSWLPLPFWVYGGAMTLLGNALTTARVTALCLGIAGALAVWFAARAVGMQRPSAWFGAMLAACFPHSAVYGAAMVPDYPTAVLALVASVTLGSRRCSHRLMGAVAACLATLCRYETWPIAAVVVAFAIVDATRDRARRATYGLAALLAPSGALAWLLHGTFEHGDALFFLKRVSAYRRALGSPGLDASTRLLRVPSQVLLGEPELTVLLLGTLVAVVALTTGRTTTRQKAWLHVSSTWTRPAIALLSIVAFLTLGDWLDGAPTHHEDRTLLSIWLGMAMLAGALMARLLFTANMSTSSATQQSTLNASATQRPLFRWLAFGIVAVLTSGTAVLRSRLVKREPFVDRSRELCVGKLASERVPPDASLAIYTEDFGYFAVLAGLARSNAGPLSRHDPREKRTDPMQNAASLEAELRTLKSQHLVLPKARQSSLPPSSSVLGEACEFLVVRIGN